MRGKEHNKQAGKKLHTDPAAGKSSVVGRKDSDKVVTEMVSRTNTDAPQGFIEPNAKNYTEQAKAFQGLPYHETAKH